MKSGIDEKPKELMFFFYLFMSLIVLFTFFFFGTVCVYETQLQLPRQ